jgi:GNAT superfamily N-acetyltransferase
MSRSMTCPCGAEFTAADTEALVEPVFEHFDTSHPEYGLSRVSVRNYLDAEDRSTGPVEPVEGLGSTEIVPISPDRAGDVIRFFDVDAFPDNPAWGSCYCMFYFLGGNQPEWGHLPWQEVRQAQFDRIESGSTTGTLAYVDGRLAGWCNASARSHFPGKIAGEDEEVCSVVCFVVSPPYRGHGLATRLLDTAIEGARTAGFRSVEAYPKRDPDSAAAAFVGSLELFQRAGFYVASEDPLVVRLDL